MYSLVLLLLLLYVSSWFHFRFQITLNGTLLTRPANRSKWNKCAVGLNDEIVRPPTCCCCCCCTSTSIDVEWVLSERSRLRSDNECRFLCKWIARRRNTFSSDKLGIEGSISSGHEFPFHLHKMVDYFSTSWKVKIIQRTISIPDIITFAEWMQSIRRAFNSIKCLHTIEQYAKKSENIQKCSHTVSAAVSLPVCVCVCAYQIDNILPYPNEVCSLRRKMDLNRLW